MPGARLGAGNILVNKTNTVSALVELRLYGGYYPHMTKAQRD